MTAKRTRERNTKEDIEARRSLTKIPTAVDFSGLCQGSLDGCIAEEDAASRLRDLADQIEGSKSYRLSVRDAYSFESTASAGDLAASYVTFVLSLGRFFGPSPRALKAEARYSAHLEGCQQCREHQTTAPFALCAEGQKLAQEMSRAWKAEEQRESHDPNTDR
jgi:hypothetical protein